MLTWGCLKQLGLKLSTAGPGLSLCEGGRDSWPPLQPQSLGREAPVTLSSRGGLRVSSVLS